MSAATSPAGYNFQESNGFNIAPVGNEDDGFERRTFNLRAGLSIVEGVSVDFNLRRSTTQSDYDDFDGPPLALQTAVDALNVADADIWMGGARLTWDMFDGGLTHSSLAATSIHRTSILRARSSVRLTPTTATASTILVRRGSLSPRQAFSMF